MLRGIRYGTELRRFTRNPLTIAALIVVTAIPLLYGALYLWAFWNPTGHLDKLPVALVVQDTGAQDPDGKHIDAGTQVADELLKAKTVDWKRTTGADAAVGLADGDYQAVLTIPPNFSEAVVSAGTEHPTTAPLDIRYNDANGYTARTLVSSVMREVRAAVSASLGEQMVDKLLVGFTEIHENLAKAADGGHQVSDGAAKARDGSASLADGAHRLADGADQLATGTHSAASGSGELATGAETLASGAHTAADGAANLSTGLGTLRSSTAALPDSTAKLAAGSAQVAEGNRQLADKVSGVVDRVDAADDRLGTVVNDAQTARADTVASLSAYVVSHPDDATAADLLAHLQDGTLDTALSDLRAHASGLRTTADQARTDTATLAAGAQQVADGNAALAAATPKLTAGIGSAADGAAKLSSGTVTLAGGAEKLSGGLATLHNGLLTLDHGAAALRTGSNQLADGADGLHSGLVSLADGADELSQGLDEGVAQIPTYNDAERKATSSVMADPVSLDTSFSHQAAGNGEGFAPYFVGLALYVGAMILWMVLRPVSQRLLSAAASATRVTYTSLQPALVLGAAQVLLLIGVLVGALGLDAENLAAVVGFTLLVSLAFITLQQAIGIAFGPTGRVLVLILLMLQLTSAGGTYPSQLTPTFFQRLHEVLPMTQVVNGLREAITGELDARFWTAVAYLAVLAVVSFGLACLAAARNRVWTMTRLHPAVSL